MESTSIKKKVLIVYPQMMLGGSTTSLLSILNTLDSNKYDIDLLLMFSGGPFENWIPQVVNRLPYGYLYQNQYSRMAHRLLSVRYMRAYIRSKRIARKNGERAGHQYLSSCDVDFYRNVDREYDVAIGFLEGYSIKYVAKRVKAKKKLGWFHLDYQAAQMSKEYDLESFSKLDSIVLVSQNCKESFDQVFPEFADKTVVVENILTKEYIDGLAQQDEVIQDFSTERINLVTTCRIDFKSKGLDRAVSALKRIKEEQKAGFELLRWYIIGDGCDYIKLQEMIKEAGLNETIILLGRKNNPIPYIKNMSLFFLPSRFEGKPMAVTEAQILGLPVLATDYLSAPEQITNLVDGRVVENSEAGIYQGLCEIIVNPAVIKKWRMNVRKTDYSNRSEIAKIESLLL